MSSTTVIFIIIGGVVALILVGLLNSVMEKQKLEKARKKAEMLERQQRFESLSESLPKQFLTVALKQELHRLELYFAEQVLAADPGNRRVEARVLALQERFQQGSNYVITNAEAVLQTEEQVKEVRFLLESWQAQLKRAAEYRLLTAAQLKPMVSHIQLQLLKLYLDYFRQTGQSFMRQGLPRQARLAYERAVKLLQRQTDPKFATHRQEFEQLLKQADAQVALLAQKTVSQAAGLVSAAEAEQSDEWKKKQLYD